MQIAPVVFDLQNRIANQLSWPVVRDVAATIHFNHRPAMSFDLGAVNQQVIVTAGTPNRVGRRVFEQQQRVGNLVGGALGGKFALQFPRRQIRHNAKSPHV